MARKKLNSVSQEQFWPRFTLTESDPDAGTFRGIASVFGSLVEAWVPTIVERGAFAKTLKEHGARVKLLWQHDLDEPIGVSTKLAETDQGLELEGRISQTQRGRDSLTLMRDGVLDELSIGFDPIRWEMREKADGDGPVRHLKEVRLREISLVTFAADPLAKIQSVHAVVPFQDLPLVDEAMPWDAGAAHKRLVDACSLDGNDPDWQRFKRGHLWYDDDEPEKITSYKFQIADIVAGKLLAVPRAIFASAAILQGGRGGTSIPQPEQEKMKSHLSRYYKKLERTAPWDREKESLDFLAEMLACMPSPSSETHEGKVLSARNKKLLQDAIGALTALIAAAEPPEPEPAAQGTTKDALTVTAEQLAMRKRQLEIAAVALGAY